MVRNLVKVHHLVTVRHHLLMVRRRVKDSLLVSVLSARVLLKKKILQLVMVHHLRVMLLALLNLHFPSHLILHLLLGSSLLLLGSNHPLLDFNLLLDFSLLSAPNLLLLRWAQMHLVLFQHHFEAVHLPQLPDRSLFQLIYPELVPLVNPKADLQAQSDDLLVLSPMQILLPAQPDLAHLPLTYLLRHPDQIHQWPLVQMLSLQLT